MVLVSLPDICKLHPEKFTLGAQYQVLGTLGNGVIVMSNDGERSIILETRVSH